MVLGKFISLVLMGFALLFDLDMAKYIDADRLRKEVKRLEKGTHKSALGCADSETRKFHEGKDFAYQHVGILIDSLQQEQSEVDLEKAAQHVYESWMGSTMNDVRRDMVELGKVLNARKED